MDSKQKTIRSVVWGLFLKRIEENGFSYILSIFVKIIFTTIFIFYLINPEYAKYTAMNVFEYKNSMVPKLIFGILIGYYVEFFTKIIFILLFRIPKKFIIKLIKKISEVKISTLENIEGIPTFELIDHLFENETFKFFDIKNKFKITQKKYESLSKKLESIGVLFKDPTKKNARVFNTDFSRKDISKILNNNNSVESINPLSRVSGNTVHFGPTKNSAN